MSGKFQRYVLHDIEQFSDIVLQWCASKDNAMMYLQGTQLLKEFTFVILQRLSFINDKTLPFKFPQEGNSCSSSAISSNNNMRFKIERRFRTT